jgi:hypothetical protein
MLITTFNPTVENLETTNLTDPISAGATSLKVGNNNRFAANDRVMIGEMGQEKTEVVTVSSVTGGTDIGIGATTFDHEDDTPIYRLRFDQIKIYKSDSLTGSYVLLATVDIDVDNDELKTFYDDTSGTASNFYKTSAYHSVSTLESALSDPIAGTGWRRRQVGYIIDQILTEVGDPGEQNVSRLELLGYFNDVNDDLLTNVSKPYDFLHARATLTRTANTSHIDFPTDANGDPVMWKFDRMDYNYIDNTTNPVTDQTRTLDVMPVEEFRNTYTNNNIDTTTVSDNQPAFMTIDTSVNRFRFSHPFSTTSGNVFYLYYWKYFDEINSEGDEIETPTARVYKLYCKGMYYRKKAVTESSYNAIADRYFADYQIEKGKYKGVDRKDKGTPRAFRPVSRTVKGFRR